ncbi:sulfatase [Flavivirga amylovorans]|uniref:Sulfatase n=1 Tax=Flavivirga amylovorans TaxID=870486 RepID=A0ABT8WWJ3_9FLAO|nr:sulfatase [Flavivirga amylovorans]MDO5985838.1 sulfatase [Flavivirga amylovorans]
MKKILIVITALYFGQIAIAQEKKAEKPNIVLFFVDDLGWNNLGYRNPEIFKTPNIDQLAKESVDFPQAYVVSPSCSPSRAMLVTGKHAARINMVRHISDIDGKAVEMIMNEKGEPEHHIWKADPAQEPSKNWLDLEHVTYAEALKKQGYYNLFAGKWHLGSKEYHPIHQGFDRQIGTTDHGHPSSYYPDFFDDEPVFEDAAEKDEYLTDRLTNEVVGFIEDYKQEKPFMLSMWYYNVHSPNIGRKDLIPNFENNPGLKGKVQRKGQDLLVEYAAQVMAVDESVGKIRAALKEKGIDKNTVIIFTSDQGSLFEWEPYRGAKKTFTLGEGGCRVPFIINWPGVTKSGSINRNVVKTTDVFPTLVEIAGGNPEDYKDLDGVSLVSTIKKNKKIKRDDPFVGYRSYKDLYASVREGEWKLLGYRSGKVELYNVEKDRVEANDVAEKNPRKVKKLLKKLKKWEVDMGVEQYSGFNKK